MSKRTKDYLKGFKHGVSWAMSLLGVNIEQIKLDSKKAIKSLKEGR